MLRPSPRILCIHKPKWQKRPRRSPQYDFRNPQQGAHTIETRVQTAPNAPKTAQEASNPAIVIRTVQPTGPQQVHPEGAEETPRVPKPCSFPPGPETDNQGPDRTCPTTAQSALGESQCRMRISPVTSTRTALTSPAARVMASSAHLQKSTDRHSELSDQRDPHKDPQGPQEPPGSSQEAPRRPNEAPKIAPILPKRAPTEPT